jgi:hypothetical protein
MFLFPDISNSIFANLSAGSMKKACTPAADQLNLRDCPGMSIYFVDSYDFTRQYGARRKSRKIEPKNT